MARMLVGVVIVRCRATIDYRILSVFLGWIS